MRPPSTLLQLNAILVLFCAAAMLFTNGADGQMPPPQQDNGTLGLGGLPIPAKKGQIDLPSGTKLTKDKKEFKEYQHNDKTFEPCNVEIGEDGNIEVFYDDLASTKGCTVDLLVNKMDQIEFVAKVEDKEKNCVTVEIKDNILPFIFNEANNGLTTLTNGLEDGGDEFCANKEKCQKKPNGVKCIKRTMYDIGWDRIQVEGVFFARGHLNQVGESVDDWFRRGKSDEAKLELDVKMAVGDVSDKTPLVTINELGVQGQSAEFPDGGLLKKKPLCNKPRTATPPPAIWKVKSGEFKDKYFVTFHFFPQKSAGVGGPKCNGEGQLSFIFQKDFALGIPTIPKPQPTTTRTTIGSTTPQNGSTTTTPGNESTTPNGTTSSAPPPTPETTEPTGGLSTAAIVGIVAGSVLVVAIIVAVVVYFLCCRNGKDAANSEDDEHLEDAEGGTAGHAGGNDTANS